MYLPKEASRNEASFSFYFKNDSLNKLRYENVLKLYKSGNHVKSLELALALYSQFNRKKNDDELYEITTLIADIYDKSNNSEKALNYYKKSLFLLNKNYLEYQNRTFNNEINFSKIYLRIGSSFQKLQRNDSAKIYYEKLNDLPSLNDDILSLKASSYVNLSGIYELDSIYSLAEEYAEKAINIHKASNNKLNLASALNNLGNIYLSQKRFIKAKKTYLDGIELLKYDNNENAVGFKASLYYNLAWAMRNLKEYKAYDFQELSYEIEDGMRDKDYKRMIATVTAENDVNVIKKQEENKRLRQKTTFWIFIIVCVIIIISLLYWLSLYRLKQKNLGLKLSQTQLLQSQNIEKLKSESQIRILNATIDGKESERKDIAETLHDSVSALLSSANLHLIATKSQFKGRIPIEIDKTQSIIAEASIKIRDLSHTLVSSVLLKFGLKYALKDMASKYSNSVLEIDLDAHDLRRYDQNFEIKIYNIIQELVNNVLKHSKAENTFMKLYEKEGKICFQISDDGVGFDKTNLAHRDGLGLNHIQSRIQMMNGVFIMESVIGEGTFVSVKLPITEKTQVSPVAPIL